ncbi:hypothetical protein [Stratiformator vulcanicus]|uniref:Plasmid stabilization system protein n=1 Tax=Stratiformator vulcanicus TaxID=2527980 RepID=A0A517R520_9PLAN|nr:hypothetical protein [Stratiformator vulcanicus]QDT38986.1 hypothetical protein Pan189_33860 [Stratiformator vulcanicus]
MKHFVNLLPDAERELTEIWLAADDRDAVTEAADRIEKALAHDPASFGESRGDGSRISFAPPLAVRFSVMVDDRRVDLGHFWQIADRSR